MPLQSKLNKLKLLSLFLILSATSGCAIGLTDPLPLNNYCIIARPIGYDSKRDTAETIKQIENHNSRWVCVCEKDCPNASEIR